jgi:hypothetical protein
MRYASETSVPVEKTRAEIETTLNKYGADQFGYAQDTSRGLASIQFRAHERHIRFVLKLPDRNDKAFTFTPKRREVRSPEDRYKAWEQACRQRWRALGLCIKAKLEAVECGISEFEDEFLAHIVLPGGGTVSQLMRPQIDRAYISGEPPPGISGMLPYEEPSEQTQD